MLLAVLSDVHANLPALEAVLADAWAYHPDGYVVAGDLTGGPRPNETIARLRTLDAWLIRGNSDNNLLRLGRGEAPPEWYTCRQWALARWSLKQLGEHTYAYLAALPEERVIALPGASPLRVVHGSPGAPADGLDPANERAELDHVMAACVEPVLICGHTHEAWYIEAQGQALASPTLVLNPGAVCGPLDGTIGAEYALLEWRDQRWHAHLRQVPYDIGRVRTAFEESGLLAEGGALARAFLRSIETGRNIAEDFLAHAYGLTARAGLPDARWVPDALWDEAAATFAW